MRIVIQDHESQLREWIELELQSRYSADVVGVDDLKALKNQLSSSEWDWVVLRIERNSLEDFQGLDSFFSNKNTCVVFCENFAPSDDYLKVFSVPTFFTHRASFQSEFHQVFQNSKVIDSDRSILMPEWLPLSFGVIRRLKIQGLDFRIRIGSDRYIKLVQSRDRLEETDLQRYERKGVDRFYVSVKEFNELIQIQFEKCSHKASTLTGAEQIQASLDLQAVVFEATQALGISFQVQKMVEVQMHVVQTQIEAKPKLSELLSRFQAAQGDYLYAHSLLTGLIAGQLASSLDWASEATLSKLSLAAIMHDLALAHPMHARIHSEIDLLKSEPPLTPSDAQAWRVHPQTGATYILEFPDLPRESALIIEQHHEFPDGSGYPKGLTEKQIAPLSAVFIVAHDFAHFYLEEIATGKKSLRDYLNARKTLYSKGVFKRAIESLQTA